MVMLLRYSGSYGITFMNMFVTLDFPVILKRDSLQDTRIRVCLCLAGV
jgi:hypothetical protein